ncbi:MAG: outer membrane protein assembly factor BamB family protein [Thermoguttaceae bacterium]
MKRAALSSRRFRGTGISALLAGLWLVATLLPAAEEGRSRLPEVFPADRLLWELDLGSHQYTVPRIDGGQVFLGTDDMELEHPAVQPSGGGIFMCRDAATGRLVWQLPIPRNMEGNIPPSHFDHWKCGICSRPVIDGDRLFVVGPRGDVLCIDRDGQADGNDGPFLDDRRYMGVAADSAYQLTKADGDIVWRLDMVSELGVVPHDVCGSSPVEWGDCVYFCTSNGQDNVHAKMVNPQAPSLIAVEKATGRLVAIEDEGISARTFHGQWSSPVAADFGGRPTIVFGGGDGILYGFEPAVPGLGGPDAGGQKPGKLKCLWRRDCCPADYRVRDGEPVPYSGWKKKSPDGPSEIISTPAVDRGRIYVAIGQSPVHGAGQGALSCVDGATGELIWQNRQVGRTLSEAAISDGLLYLPDCTGTLHCIDAATGRIVWQHDLEGGVWCASATIAEGRVYLGTERMTFWVLKAGREKEVLARGRTPTMAITTVVADGTFFLPTQRSIFAVKLAP